MNRTLTVLLLLIHGSLSGRILLMNPTQQDGGSVGAIKLTEAQLFFDSIPPQDRNDAIIYYLVKGLIEKAVMSYPMIRQDSPLLQTFDHLDEPLNFSQDLLEWTQEEFTMADFEVIEMVTYNVVCLDNGKCIHIGDVGSQCCIF